MDEIKQLEKELAALRAQYQRLETRYAITKQQLVAVLWCNGPQEIPKSSALVPSDVRITERAHGQNARLSVTLLKRGAVV